jgi:transcriptional repressor NrdR
MSRRKDERAQVLDTIYSVGLLAPTAYMAQMRCPFCSSEDTQVKDSRQAEDNSAVRRRRQCGSCAGRFTTFERVQLRDLTVIKKSGRRTPFDRDKLARSVMISLQKRPVDPERIEQMISGVVRQLEAGGTSDIDSDRIGALVMEGLSNLDKIAYVRYASVYKDFREAEDFGAFVQDQMLTTDEDE